MRNFCEVVGKVRGRLGLGVSVKWVDGLSRVVWKV